MPEIYSNDYMKIIKERHLIKIYFSYSIPALINSLTKTELLPGATVTNNYKTLIFNAFSLKTFEEYKLERKKVGIKDALSMGCSLSSQLEYLIKKEKNVFLGYTPEKIFVVNNQTFIYLDSEIHEIINDKILISYPFNKSDFFLSPELLQIKEIPSYVHYKTTYFSFAFLLLYILSNCENNSKPFYESEIYLNYLKKDIPIKCIIFLNNILYSNSDTKIKWFLSRCLVEDPTKRVILFI